VIIDESTADNKQVIQESNIAGIYKYELETDSNAE